MVGNAQYPFLMQARCQEGLATLANTIVTWQHKHGRHDLPWQGTTDPYRIWLSEIMLQQTQVATVIPYYQRFLSRFPDVNHLARASLDDVMPYWAGLGYYARARNLHRCARTVYQEHQGHFPPTSAELATLPGIGRSTAAAIAAFAWGERSPIMDGNVKRVFTRYFGIYGDTSRRATETVLWDLAQRAIQLADNTLDIRRYIQGQMDLGATICTRSRPACHACPLADTCFAYRENAQAELPQRRPRKALPEKACVMLMVLHQRHVLLQQQPEPGIWGGLWSLPMVENEKQLQPALDALGAGAASVAPLPALTHTFSHFKLHIQALRIELHQPLQRELDPSEQWIALSALSDTALPAPVKTLLQAEIAAPNDQVCAGR